MTAQLAAYDDHTLEQLFAEGILPQDYEHNAPFMTRLPPETAACVMRQTHAWQIPEDVKQGLLLKVRSEIPFE